LQDGVGPQLALVDAVLNKARDLLVEDVDEARDVLAVLAHHAIAQPEHVHQPVLTTFTNRSRIVSA
jgi:hypothetical protein